MKRFLIPFFALFALTLAHAADKNTIRIHPGEVVYARFEIAGKKLKLVSASHEKDEAAQVVFSFPKDEVEYMRKLKVENKFPKDFSYKVEMRSLVQKREIRLPATPVVANKVAFESYPVLADQLEFYDFKLEK